MNPYSGASFLEFFSILLQRLFVWKGELAFDELQCLVLACLSAGFAFIGPFLVARKMTMLANALSHTILFGIVLAFLVGQFFLEKAMPGISFLSFQVLFPGAIISAFLTVGLTEGLNRRLRVQEDASIGLVFTTLFALGVLLVTLFTKNTHIGVEIVMGNLDALHKDDLFVAAFFALGVGIGYTVFFRGFLAISFDSVFATTINLPIKKLGYLFVFFTAIASITAFRCIGVILFLAYLVGPSLIARLYTGSLKKLIFLSFCIALGVSLLSVAFSRHILTVFGIPLSTSGLAVSFLLIIYFFSVAIRSCERVSKK